MSVRSGYSGGKTLNNTVPRRLFALGLFGIVFLSVCALLPSPAQAQCKRWDVSGNWVLQQANGINENVSLQQGKWGQQSANLSGTAAVTLTANSNGSFTTPQYPGVVSGNITGNAFTIVIARDSSTSSGSSTAQYRFTGTVGASGYMKGTSANGVHWVSSRRMTCADDANPPVPKQKTDASPTSNAQAEESSSNETDDQHGKHKKNKKKHHHHDDDPEQGSN